MGVQSKDKLTSNDLDLRILAIIHTLKPYEEIRIKADEFGKPGRIIVLSSSTTILDYEDTNNKEKV